LSEVSRKFKCKRNLNAKDKIIICQKHFDPVFFNRIETRGIICSGIDRFLLKEKASMVAKPVHYFSGFFPRGNSLVSLLAVL
jgi:hypothetical protein